MIAGLPHVFSGDDMRRLVMGMSSPGLLPMRRMRILAELKEHGVGYIEGAMRGAAEVVEILTG